MTVLTCEPADPASKGGSESTVKIAKADLVPKDSNLREEYASFAELQEACEAFCDNVNGRVHRVTRRVPVEMLAEERARLHMLPEHPHTVAFGLTRVVPAGTPMVTFEAGQYSVPHTLLGQRVWVRVHGRGQEERVVFVHVGEAGPVEVARHARATPGSPRLDEAHFPPAPAGALGRAPKAKSAAEAAFLALGDGARLWLTEAAAAGTTKMRLKMTQALALAKLCPASEVDWALGHGRGARPVRRGRPGLDPGPPPHRHRRRAHPPGRGGSLPDPGHRGLGRARRAGRTRRRRRRGRRADRGGLVSRTPATPADVPVAGVPAAPPLPEDVQALLRRLRMPHVRRHAPDVVATAKAQRWEPIEVLRALLSEEVAGRERSALATRRASAGFPTGKTFHAWQDEASSIPAPTQQALRTLEWVRRRENLVVCGPSGTGKTFLLEALGQQAVEEGLRVAWFTLEDLGVLLRRHRADDTVTKAITRVLRADLVVVDDIGLLPVAADAAEGLYRLVDAAYERRSVAISSNLHPAAFDELMPTTLATATVDRLLHHAHVCQTTGKSVRLSQALAGAGVVPFGSTP